MTKSEFLNEIEMIIEADPGSVTVDAELESLEGWGSMAVISFIAMADEKLGVILDVSALASCQTVGDLARLLEGKVV